MKETEMETELESDIYAILVAHEHNLIASRL